MQPLLCERLSRKRHYWGPGMLTTRLWMGAVLVLLTVGMLVGDHSSGARGFRFCLLFQLVFDAGGVS